MDLKGISNGGVRFVRKARGLLGRQSTQALLQLTCRLGVGFLLASALMFGDYAPLGLGYVAALGTGGGAVAGLCGVVLGYLCILYRANGLKYLAIVALIYTAKTVFSGSSLKERMWFMPLAAGVSTLSLGTVFLLDDGLTLQNTVFYISEVVLTFGSAFLYQVFFHPHWRMKRSALTCFQNRLLVLCLVATLLLPLMRVSLFDILSPGRVLAQATFMLCGYYGGAGLGVIGAVLQGICAGEVYCAVYGVCAIFAATMKKWGSLAFLCGHFAVSLCSMLLMQNMGGVALCFETVGASAVFFAARMRFGEELKSFWQEHESLSIPVYQLTRQSLKAVAKAFADLGELLQKSFSKEPNDQNIATVFEKPAQQVCKKCVLCNHCWEQDYITTRNALSDTTRTMLESGRLKVTDLPFHFSTRCLHVGEFVDLVNRELQAYFVRKQHRTQLRENRAQICKQYRDVSQVLESIAEGELPVLDAPAQKRLQRLLREAGVQADVCVYRDSNRRLHLLMESEEAENECVLQNFARQMGVTLGRAERRRNQNGYQIRVGEREALHASLGVACKRKEGNPVCGDTVGHCKLENGLLCILLADGMGTGANAAKESRLAVDLLIRFLESGVAPQSALMTVHSALQMKAAQETGFTTLDLLCVNLFTGETVLYKFGSAPSYFRNSEETKCSTCTSMPLGISCAGAPTVEQVKTTLHPGDDVILTSDGISDQAAPDWLMQTLQEENQLSPQAFAKAILLRAEQESEISDDRTVLVLRLQQE